MSDPIDDDLQQLASEYVLGTLPAGRRRRVARALPHDGALRAAVQEWEERLLPLTKLVEPVAPSPQLWARIEQGLADAGMPAPTASRGSRFGRWWNSIKFWRGLAATGFAAASIMAVMINMRLLTPPAPQFMVVLAAPQNMQPGWVIQTSSASSMRLVPLGPTSVPQQKSLQLWTKGEGWKGPVSLGLVTPGQPIEVPLDRLPPLQQNQLFEITLEPYNGSPLDRPTGPILYIGRAVKMM